MADSLWGHHVRAALALRGFTVNDAAVELNLSAKTLLRTIQGDRLPRDWETRRLAEVLEVPEWFIRHGLPGPPPADIESPATESIERLTVLVACVQKELAGLNVLLAEAVVPPVAATSP